MSSEQTQVLDRAVIDQARRDTARQEQRDSHATAGRRPRGRHRLRVLGSQHRPQPPRAGELRAVVICDRSPAALKRAQRTYPGVRADDRLQRHPAVARYRRGCGHHARLDPLRAGKGGARERQARVRREAIHLHAAAGRGVDRARRAQESEDHGGSHLPLQRRGQEDPGHRRCRHARARCITSTRRA